MVSAQGKGPWEQSNPSVSLCSVGEKNYMRTYKEKELYQLRRAGECLFLLSVEMEASYKCPLASVGM